MKRERVVIRIFDGLGRPVEELRCDPRDGVALSDATERARQALFRMLQDGISGSLRFDREILG